MALSTNSQTNSISILKRRVSALEAEGMTRSDAQGVVEAEIMQETKWTPVKAEKPAKSPTMIRIEYWIDQGMTHQDARDTVQEEIEEETEEEAAEELLRIKNHKNW